MGKVELVDYEKKKKRKERTIFKYNPKKNKVDKVLKKVADSLNKTIYVSDADRAPNSKLSRRNHSKQRSRDIGVNSNPKLTQEDRENLAAQAVLDGLRVGTDDKHTHIDSRANERRTRIFTEDGNKNNKVYKRAKIADDDRRNLYSKAKDKPKKKIEKISLRQKLQELSKIDPKGSNIKENIEAVLENNPDKLVPQITPTTPRVAMKGNDELVYFGDVVSSKKKQKKEEIRDPFDRSNVPLPKEVINNSAPEESTSPKEEKKNEGVSSQFKDALGFFLPQIIGGLAGAAFEGTEGAIGGIDQAGKARDAFLKHQDNKEKLAIERSKEGRLTKGKDRFQLSTMQNDKGESEVFRVNLDSGEKESLGKKGYAKGYVKDPSSGFLVNRQTGKTLNLSGDSTNKTFFSALTPVQRSQFQDLRKGFLADSKPMRDAAAKVEGLISKQVDEAMVNSVAANQLGAQVASIYENGRLTDEDVLRYTRRTGIPDRVADMIKDLKHGTISADKAEDIKSALAVLREVVIDQVNSKAKERSDVFSSDWGLPSEDVNQAFWKKMEHKKVKKKSKDSNEPTLQERIRAAESNEELAEIMKEHKGNK